MEREGLPYVAACKRLGTTPKSTGATHTHKPAAWEPKPAALPGDAWIARAGRFVDRCAAALAAGGPGLDYARSRGLTARTCAALRIGWHAQDAYEDRAAWGLPPETNPQTGKPRRVWMPAGLVIPTLSDGHVAALKIRRSAWTPEDELPKYCAVSGGGKLPMVLAPGKGKPVVIIESEIDAVLVAQVARDVVAAVALRTARAKPDAEAHALLLAAPLILVATDADEAGATAWPWWREHYANAKRWPVPSGKDVGDLMAVRGLVRAWILAGLPEPERVMEPTPIPVPSSPAGKSSLRRAADLAHGEPCPYDAERLATFAASHPHLVCCPATRPNPWWWVERSWCDLKCQTPCEVTQ